MVILVLGLLAAPLAAGAEQSGKVFRIGLLSNVPPTHPEGARLWGTLIHGLRDLGYVEGQNIIETVGKQLELLKEIVPRVSRVTVLGNPTNRMYPPWLGEVTIASRSLGVQLQTQEARAPDDFERAFAAMTRERAAD